MAETHSTREPKELIFPIRRTAAAGAVLWLAGGLGALGLAMVGLVVAEVAHVNPISLQLMTTLPTLLGIGALVAAWTTSRTPRAVGVGPEGVRIETRRGSHLYGWDRVGWSTVQPGTLNGRRVLRLYDTAGRPLATLSDALEDFDGLVEAIAAGVAARGDQTADRVRASRSKRSALFLAGTGVVFLAVAGAVAWMTYRERRAEQLLAASAVPGEAEIEQRFLAPNGVTPRLVYRVTTPDGRTATRNAEVERPVWDALAGARTVPVLYVLDEPAISCLASGEARDRDPFKEPLIGYGLPVTVALLSLFFLAMAILMWLGWDIDLDSKTGRFSIKRFGTGR
jgi:hypothetical protein